MSAAEIAAIGAVVMTLTQILKRAVPGEGYGIYLAGGTSLVCVLVYVASAAEFPPNRTDLWTLFSGWVTVFATAAGLHSVANVPTTRAERVRRVRETLPAEDAG
jgi:hypothetical protein